MSSEGYLEDEATRHAIYVALFAMLKVDTVTTFITQAIEAAQDRVSAGLSSYGTQRYERQIQVLQRDLIGIYSEMKGQLELDLKEFAGVEAKYTADLLKQVVKPTVQLNTPSPQMVTSAATFDPMSLESRAGVQKISIRGALDQFGTKKSAEIISEIKIGAALGETTPTISRRISSLHQLQRDQAVSLVRTVTNHIASTARVETLKANDDILEGMRRIATLDARTSLFCMGIDQTIIPLHGPKPPYHWNCRTSLIPVLKAEYAREIPGSTRPSVGPDGAAPVASKTSYQDWLKRQPVAFQREVLGPSRYALFSKGELTLDRFVDTNGKRLNLEQLKKRQPAAFKAAGI
ncbi:phage head morphogenesis protein [Pseudomonas sp. Leaf127]|uniref:hypothetical protein n=1 Tax=Pseudomonas sp. Leaf127 TaxID=1736267 RepID=UPI00070272AC|nr:hypothetical protein [Pseudomonas sp. Leaf127]KQQ60147.1 phage head morphogenesis protein [Pseudomonas sp. Leaf127]